MMDLNSASAASDSIPVPQSANHLPSSQAVLGHIRFPDRFLTTRTNGGSSRSSSISFNSPMGPVPQSQSRSEPRKDVDLTEGRRRVRSLEPGFVGYGNIASKKASMRHHGSRRMKGTLSPLQLDSFGADFEPSAFSDEYDLSHEDPKILQDVQRALHLQSRRRDRKSHPPHATTDESPPSPDVGMATVPHASTSAAPPAVQSSPQYTQVINLTPEVDFSPSTRSAPLHPVPLSSNGGATLDWTCSQSEDEKLDRRWTITRNKRKGKEKTLPSNNAVIEKQEALFIDRVSRIKAEASPATVRKAAIVSEQLGRRYNVIYGSISSGDPANLAKIARWYAGSGAQTRAWLDSAEPLTWLKHLLDRRGNRRTDWHMSALIMEEYAKFKKGTALPTPPVHSLFMAVESFSLEATPSQSTAKSTTQRVSAPPSDSSPGTSSSRVRSTDGHVSFRPFVESFRGSLNTSQSRSEGKTQGWRRSIPGFFDSSSANGSPSLYHYRNSSGGLSPAGSRINFPDIAHRFRRHPIESDEGSSSPPGSQSEDQNEFGISRHRRRGKPPQQSRLSKLQSPQESGAEINVLSELSESHDTTAGPAVSTSFPHDGISEPEVTPPSEQNHESATQPKHAHTFRPPRPYRSTSLPSCARTLDPTLLKRDLDLDEDKLEREYERRSRTLEELKSHNHRLRHRMQRVASDVREYELVCSNVMLGLDVPYRSLPPELLDAITHDPSSVTSGTRKRRGWMAVEDIHDRVIRQREIIRIFLSTMKVDDLPAPDNVLDKPISTLMEKLQALEREREPLQAQADNVTKILTQVRAVHAIVKEEYNEAVSYTSLVYPELSRIIALEESYKYQYQQVWEFGMDALTFILDTITPFWRNYGKTIGEDMQDFLIIPWYRNEFTGESKRYPVESLPRRSVRHWIALCFLSALTLFVTFLQVRAAITSTWHYRLLWIVNQGFRWTIMPFFWMAIVIQWFAVMFEVCVVLLQVSVIAWWLGWIVGICT
ncbi:hypothetical protein BDN67DRAFT_966497 [Paxillus ammoniavirescens]|nr:hypothetical protein BDN67DRAFT_966497 [Paxillus ammoniavirescens]